MPRPLGDRPAGRWRCRSPCRRSSGVLVGPHDRGIDADLPTDQPGGLGPGLQGDQDARSGAIALQAVKHP